MLNASEVHRSMFSSPRMLPVLAGLVLLMPLLALTWRSGAEADDGAPAPSSTTTIATTVLSAVPAPADEATPQPLLASPSVAALLTRYLRSEAGPRERREVWAPHIREVVVGLRTATIRTDLGDALDDRAIAEEIVAAVGRFSTSQVDTRINALDVDVLGASQRSIASQSPTGLARPSPRR